MAFSIVGPGIRGPPGSGVGAQLAPRRALLRHQRRSSSASSCLRRTLMPFSSPLSGSAMMRCVLLAGLARTGCSGRAARRRAAARTAVSARCASSCATVSCRSVEPGWPDDEHQVVLRRAGPVERQVVGRRRRLAVFVDAQHGTCRGTSAGTGSCPGRRRTPRCAVFGREHQAHVVVALVLVEEVLAALVERHRLADGAGPWCRRPSRRPARAASAPSCAPRSAALSSMPAVAAFDLGGDVLHLHQHVGVLRRAAHFLLAAARR